MLTEKNVSIWISTSKCCNVGKEEGIVFVFRACQIETPIKCENICRVCFKLVLFLPVNLQ